MKLKLLVMVLDPKQRHSHALPHKVRTNAKKPQFCRA